MHTPNIRLAIALTCVGLLSTAQAQGGIHITYLEPLEQVQIEQAPSSRQQSTGSTPAESLSFNAFGKHFDLRLEVNRALLGARQRELLHEGIEVYRGKLAGVSNSWVRVVIAEGIPRGMLWDGSELWAIEAVNDPSTGTDIASIYRLSDVQIEAGTLTCADITVAKDASALARSVFSEIEASTARDLGATLEIDVAIIGDFEFTNAKGPGATADLIARMNNVDGIFSAQLGVQINVDRIDTYSINDDPFSDQTTAALLLGELSNYRFTTPEQHANGLSHLFTGRNLDASMAGISYTGGLCSQQFGAGVTQGTHSVTMDSLIAAHEIGHNFGAPHDGDAPCESVPGTFLMAPQYSGSDTFSDCSISEMQARVDTAVCLTPLPSADVALVVNDPSANVLLGDIATVILEVNNLGTDAAEDVSIDVAIPAGVSLNSVSATAGDCTAGAGAASCTIGAIAAGSGATVIITAVTTAVGDADFVATVTVASDQNSDNNQATARITVDPAVDLVSIAAATVQLTLNASTTISPGIENRSSVAATDVTVVVTPDAGIRIDSASWSPGACSVTGNTVTCQASSLAAQSNSPVQIGINGTSEGIHSYSINVSAVETDRDKSNDHATGQVIVSPVANNPPSGTGGGGGGTLDWLSHLLLIFTGLMLSGRAAASVFLTKLQQKR